jgi:hypothetical protein
VKRKEIFSFAEMATMKKVFQQTSHDRSVIKRPRKQRRKKGMIREQKSIKGMFFFFLTNLQTDSSKKPALRQTERNRD